MKLMADRMNSPVDIKVLFAVIRKDINKLQRVSELLYSNEEIKESKRPLKVSEVESNDVY